MDKSPKRSTLPFVFILGIAIMGTVSLPSTTSSASEQLQFLVCEIEDTARLLDKNFEQAFCGKLAADLALTNLPKAEIAEQKRNTVTVRLQTIDDNTASYAVYVGVQKTGDNIAKPDHGPFIVSVMDANIERALPDHLKNDLTRLLALK